MWLGVSLVPLHCCDTTQPTCSVAQDLGLSLVPLRCAILNDLLSCCRFKVGLGVIFSSSPLCDSGQTTCSPDAGLKWDLGLSLVPLRCAIPVKSPALMKQV